MGQRFRLRSSFNISTYPADVQIILRAMQQYGMIVADNGSAWYISGAPDDRWNNDNLATLRSVVGSDFEAVDDSVFMADANSGQARSCDVNGDGTANVIDVQLQVNAALGLAACKYQDVDGNGSCNVLDVQRVVAAVLGSSCHIGP
jgi:hypothetical protein